MLLLLLLLLLLTLYLLVNCMAGMLDGAWPMLFIDFGRGTAAQNLAIARIGPFIFGPMLSAGGAISTPAYLTIISGRVANNNQAKAQSLIGFFYSIGAAIGTSLYSALLFDPSATGQRAVRFCYVTSGIYLLATIIVLCTAWSDDTNGDELRCCGCCRTPPRTDSGANNIPPQQNVAAVSETVAAPGVQAAASMVPSVSSEKLNALVKDTQR